MLNYGPRVYAELSYEAETGILNIARLWPEECVTRLGPGGIDTLRRFIEQLPTEGEFMANIAAKEDEARG